MRTALTLALLLAASSAVAQDTDAIRARMAAQDFAGAVAMLEKRLADGPDGPELRYLLGIAYMRGGQADRAVPVLKAAAQAEPGNVDVLLAYGQALTWSGDAASAVGVLERARQLAPDYADVATALDQARVTASDRNTPASAGQESRAGAGMDDPKSTVDRGRSVGLSARRDWLDQGLDDWTSIRLDAASTPRGELGFYGALASEHRFGLRDDALEVGAVVPLGGGWTLIPEVGVAPDARFLHETYLDLKAQREFAGGWVGVGGWRRSAYRDVIVQRAQLGAERYFGDWRAGYTLYLTRLAGTSSASHAAQLVRSYGDRSEIGAQFGTGRETAQTGAGVVASDVRAASLFVRHGFGDWSLLVNVGTTEQGDLYTRRGVTLGLARRF